MLENPLDGTSQCKCKDFFLRQRSAIFCSGHAKPDLNPIELVVYLLKAKCPEEESHSLTEDN